MKSESFFGAILTLSLISLSPTPPSFLFVKCLFISIIDHMSKSSATILLLLFILAALGVPLVGRATIFFDSEKNISFDPEYVISDDELTDYKAMTLEEIQDMLEIAGSALAQKKFQDIDGKIKLASEIIYRASQEYKINPRFLIVLLQREKSLITNPKPSQDDLNWATGFSCYDYGQPVQRFKGFATQVDKAAWRFRYYLEHPWQFRFRVGVKTETLVNWKDRTFTPGYSSLVIPKNQTTAGLYNYAPHIYDNRLFWKIWNWKIWEKWFPKLAQKFPEGSLLQPEREAGVWLIQNGKRKPIQSKNVFTLKFDFKDVKKVTYKELEQYETGEPVTFPNYSLVRASIGDLFMLVGKKKRSLTEEIFRKIGFHPEEIIEVDEADLKYYEEGDPILSPYPTGALVQDSVSKGVYWVEENEKYPLIDATLLMANFPYSHIIKTSPEELTKYKNGEPLKLKSGSLVKTATSPTIYVIEKEKRLAIASPQTFEALGYQWNAILTVPEKVLNLHELGEMIKI